MITDMASNFHIQAESTGTSSGRRTDQSSAVNLLERGNDNMSSSELAVTRGNISENMDNKLISSKFTYTGSDVKTAHKTVEHSHNFNSHCPSSSINVRLKEDITVITAQMLTNEGRKNDNQETHSKFDAEDVQTLKCNDSNIQRSWSAEISAKDIESNSIQKISNNNNKENHASNITENIKNSEEFLHLPVGPTQQKATGILEMACKIGKVISDEGRSNDIQETDTGCNSRYLEALTRSENKIKKPWNTEINKDKNKINITQKCSNNIKENHACNSIETINSTENFLDLPEESTQLSKTYVLGELSKAVQSWLHSSTEKNLMAHKITPPEESMQCADFLAIIMDPTMSSPPEKVSTLSASNENTGSLTEVETPATSTSNGTFKCRLITNSVDENFNVAHMPATTLARNSNEGQCESRSTAQKINYTNMEIKKSKQQPNTEIYSELRANTHMNLPKDVNVPISYLRPVNTYSQTESLVNSKSYFTGLMPTLSPLTPPLNVCNSIVDEHVPAAIRRQLISPLEHTYVQPKPKKYIPTILLQSNQDQGKSNAEFCEEDVPTRVVGMFTNICNKICPETPLIPTNAGASNNILSADTIHDIRNEFDIRTILPAAHASEITFEKPQPSSVNNPLVSTQLQKPSAGTALLNMTANSISNLCDPMKVSSSLIHSVASTGLLMTSTISDITSPNKTKLKREVKYQLIPNNTFNITPIKAINLEKNYCSATLCGLSPPLSSTDTFPTWASRELYTPEYTENSVINAVKSIQADGAKCAERNLVRIRGRSRGRKTSETCKIRVNTRSKNAKTKCETQKTLYSKSYLADAMGHRYGNSGRGRGNSTRDSELVEAMSHRDGNSGRGRRSSTRGSELVDAMSHRYGNSRRGRSSSTTGSELVDAMSHRYGNSRRGRSSSTTGSELVDAMSHRYGNSRRGRSSSTRGSELVDVMSHRDGNSGRGRSSSTRGSEIVDAMSHRYGNSRRGRSSSTRGCRLCRSNITHPSVPEQSEGTERKHNKLTVIRDNQKNDGRTKKTCPRRTKRQGLSNNNKSLTTLCSLDMDQLRFQECLSTGNAENIRHHIMKKRFSNRFLTKSNQEFVRKRGKQTSTLKKSTETFTSASPHVPVTNNIKINYEPTNNGEQQWPSERKSSLLTTDCSSPDTTSTENSTAVTSSCFQNVDQQMEGLLEYSAPLATEYQQHFIPVSDNIYNTYTACYPHEPDQYFSSYQNNEEKQCTAKYENIITVGSSLPDTMSTENTTAVATSSFQNSEQYMKRLSEYSAPLATEYQQNFIPVSDNIHNICTPYYPQGPCAIPYNDHYFPSHQNNEGEQCTGKHENTSMSSEIIKFNRDQEFPLNEVRRHVDRQNEYHEENIIQNGYQNLVPETEANHYPYQLQRKTARLNNEDLQQVETYRHMSAFRCTCNCCRSNRSMSTQNSAICQQTPENLKLDEIPNYKLSSTKINSFAGVHQSTVAINENIHNQQIISHPEYINVLPNTEMFQEGVHWQKLDSCSSHNTAAMQEIYVNNAESIAHNWERHRTSGYPGLPYDDRIQLPTDSNLLFKSEGKFPQPSSQSTENFRLNEVVHLSDDRKVMQKGSKKKCAKNQSGRKQKKGRSKPDKPYVCSVCGKREQYNVLLERHIKLHHANSSIHK